MNSKDLDISSASVRSVIVHRVGNKTREDGYSLSPQESETSGHLNELLLRHYLLPLVTSGEVFEFHHESDLALNAVRKFSAGIFRDNTSFVDLSQSIAKHLYSVSAHPNITGGEFIALLFDDIRLNNEPYQGLALLRVESKDDFLDVEDESGVMQLVERTGISLSRIQKGALVLPREERVYAIDALSSRTKYWNESFLKVVPTRTEETCTKAGGALLKALCSQVRGADDQLALNHRLQASLSASESVSVRDIRAIGSDFLDPQTVSAVVSGVGDRFGFGLEDDITIRTDSLSRIAKVLTSRTRLAEGVTLIVSDQQTRVSGINIEKRKQGFRATVDFETVES